MSHSIFDKGNATLNLFEWRELEMDDAIKSLSEDGYAYIAFGTSREQFPENT
jgi:hypothetical protein